MPRIYINPPKVCDQCHKDFGDVMYDAKTVYGPWGNFCTACFNSICIGLGTGLGQMYRKNSNGEFVKEK